MQQIKSRLSSVNFIRAVVSFNADLCCPRGREVVLLLTDVCLK